MEKKERGSFKGSIGFVLAAAGSAVGLGNIWRFPYLAARDGGGLFLVIYLILAVTFGFTLVTTEVVIGRKTKQSPLTAYKHLAPKWKWIGFFSCLVPGIIMPYYCAIGGWLLKYFWAFATMHGDEAAEDGYFSTFITGKFEPVLFMVIFLALCSTIIYRGVSSGIEKSSRLLMPILFIMVIGVAIFSLTIETTNEAGKVVTGLDGLKVYLIPNFDGVGILAGVMIVPAVFVFMGKDGMTTGPSLMFVSLPKVFAQMGDLGTIIGTIFFAMVLFAAITSAMSILEAVVSSFMDAFGMSRKKATIIETLIALVVGVIVCFGYNFFYFEYKLPNGATAQILDILDYLSNNILMPVVSIATCILIGWVLKPKTVIDEATKNGEKFGRKGLYIVMIKFIAPAFLIVLLLISSGVLK